MQLQSHYSLQKKFILCSLLIAVFVAITIVLLTIHENKWNKLLNTQLYKSQTYWRKNYSDDNSSRENENPRAIYNDPNVEMFVPRKRNKNEEGLFYILYWQHDWGVPSEGWGDKSRFGNCIVTYDRSKLKDAEAVVFHYTGLDGTSMPWMHYRDEDQIFVYKNHESPPYMRWLERRSDLSKFDNGFINITISYRSDSTIIIPYATGSLKQIISEGKKWVDDKLAAKSRVALWLVSKCSDLYGYMIRMELSNELVKAGLPLDRYGNCFKNRDVFSKLDEKTVNSYKFYLAFENALHCKQYITEKFWRNALSSGRVPVVWGPYKEDVTRLAPTNSFIHADDFESPATLVSYLMYLNENATAYREYFKWVEDPDERTKILAESYAEPKTNILCDMISAPKRKRTIINSISNFYLNESKECLRPK